ncbi:RING-box protein 1b, partial [Harpegnathos saltator]
AQSILQKNCAICRRSFSYLRCNECETDQTSASGYSWCMPSLSKCGHLYHFHCFSRWLKTRWQKCPADDCKWKLRK